MDIIWAKYYYLNQKIITNKNNKRVLSWINMALKTCV